VFFSHLSVGYGTQYCRMPASQSNFRVPKDHDSGEMTGLFSHKGRIIPEDAIADLQHLAGHGCPSGVFPVRAGDAREHRFQPLRALREVMGELDEQSNERARDKSSRNNSLQRSIIKA